MKAGSMLLLGLAGITAYSLWKQKQAGDLLTYSFNGLGVDGKNTDLLHTTLNVRLGVHNPTDTKIYLMRIAGNIIADGRLLATIDTGGYNVTITPGDSEVNFKTVVDNSRVAGEVLSLLTGGSLPAVTFNGLLYTPFFNVPVEETFNAGVHGVTGNAPRATVIPAKAGTSFIRNIWN